MAFINDILVDVWDKVNHAFTVNVANPTSTTGLATSAKQDDIKAAINALPTTELDVSMEDLAVALKNILNALTRPMWINPSTGKMIIDSGTISTVSTITNVPTIGNNDTQSLIINVMRTNWADNIRGRIT